MPTAAKTVGESAEWDTVRAEYCPRSTERGSGWKSGGTFIIVLHRTQPKSGRESNLHRIMVVSAKISDVLLRCDADVYGFATVRTYTSYARIGKTATEQIGYLNAKGIGDTV